MTIPLPTKIILLACSGFLLGAPQASFAQACTQTVSAGVNLASAISSAAAGTTICLYSGSYGTVSLSNVSKNPRVIVRSVTGQEATFRLNTTNGANGFTFDSVTLTAWNSSGSTTQNITVQNTRFTGPADLNMTGAANRNILIDNCTFIDIRYDGKEGRLSVYQTPIGSQPVGVTITNSLFENTSPRVGESDGIQVGARGVVIGPGNIFRGIQQNGFTAHVDAIQGYGQGHTVITGNFFINNEVNIGFYDGGDTETITHNVIVRGPSGISHGNNVFLSIGPNGTVAHNTFKDISIGHGAKAGDRANSNMLVQDNIFVNADLYTYTGGNNGSCNGCIYTNNLFDASSTQWGTNRILGSPTFVGGSSPITMQGYQLTSTSLGFRAAISPSGADIGTNAFTSDRLLAPTNLRVVQGQ
jgi:hypothetical protein